jgi:hypothetical protein
MFALPLHADEKFQVGSYLAHFCHVIYELQYEFGLIIGCGIGACLTGMYFLKKYETPNINIFVPKYDDIGKMIIGNLRK